MIGYRREFAHELLLDMIRIRRMEETAAQLYGSGKIRGFLHLYVGQEAVAVGVMHALGADDAVVTTYRDHGHALARGVPMTAIMAEMFGMREGCCHGHGGSMHLFDAAHRFYGGNAIVGAGLPPAVGLALADTMTGRQQVTACFFGDGAVAEGAFHESMNIAALWRLPVLFCCENNRYAMGTSLAHEHSRTDLAAKADAYNVMAAHVDGMDVLAVYEAAQAAIGQIRETGRPFFLELLTYRFRAHSMYDPDLYRTKPEIEAWKLRDPIHAFADRLTDEQLLTSTELTDLEARADREIADAVAYADAGTPEPVENLEDAVLTTVSEPAR